MTNRIVDNRGYAGSERNRKLDPKDVIWARAAVAAREVTPKQLSQMYGMTVDSVRRMLRGDTYNNIQGALVREEEVASAAQLDDEGALERLIQGKPQEVPERTPLVLPPVADVEGDDAINTFLNSGNIMPTGRKEEK